MIWFKGGLECSEDVGKVCIIVHALYSLKSAGTSWRVELASLLKDIGYISMKADPDVWIWKAVTNTGHEYYEMLFVYIDGILSISHRVKEMIAKITKFYKAKGGSIKEPEIYLGADVLQMPMSDGHMVWTTSPRTYVKNVVQVTEQLLNEDGQGYILKKGEESFPYRLLTGTWCLRGTWAWTCFMIHADDWHPLMNDWTQLYWYLCQSFYVVAVSGKPKDWTYQGSLPYLCIPQMASRQRIYHVQPDNTTSWWEHFQQQCRLDRLLWQGGRGIACKHAQAPWEPGNYLCIIDTNHASNVVTCHLYTGILIFVQNAPIIWFSKRQNTVKSATFESKLVAMRIAKDLIVGLQYKICSFVVPIRGPANVFCDNRGVVKNLSILEATLMKKHNAINYHAVQEVAAAGILWVGKEDMEMNLADMLTKIGLSEKRYKLCHGIMWWGP